MVTVMMGRRLKHMYKTMLFLDLDGGAYYTPFQEQITFLQQVQRWAMDQTRTKGREISSDSLRLNHVVFRKVSL